MFYARIATGLSIPAIIALGAARWDHEQSAIVALASSVDVRDESRWKLAFHQQTPIQPT
jgi:hypothetical protein